MRTHIFALATLAVLGIGFGVNAADDLLVPDKPFVAELRKLPAPGTLWKDGFVDGKDCHLCEVGFGSRGVRVIPSLKAYPNSALIVSKDGKGMGIVDPQADKKFAVWFMQRDPEGTWAQPSLLKPAPYNPRTKENPTGATLGWSYVGTGKPGLYVISVRPAPKAPAR